MRIKAIELDNFKSFARPTRLEFRDGFTAIAGPNGSGKSNIIDAILFGLGLSNSRALRAEKLTDLINNASDRREARVTITFGDDDQEFVVSRRIRETDSAYTSTYYLNGKVCTLTELHDLLATYRVSPHGYNVVMQMDVTRIISMTGGDRRKIIDEIAGVAEFDAKVDQARHELSTVNEQEERHRLILSEIGDRLKILQAERDHALKYRKLREERERLEAVSKLSACWELRQKVAGLQDVVTAAGEQEQKLLAAIEAAREELAERQTAFETLSAQIDRKGGDEMIAVQGRISEVQGALEKEAAIREVLSQQREDLERQRDRESEAAARHQAKLEELATRRQDLFARQERTTSELAAAEQAWQAAQAELKALYEAHGHLAEQGTAMRNRLNGVRERYNEVWREKTRLDDATYRNAEQRELMEGDRSAQQAVRAQLQKEAEVLQAELDGHQEACRDLARAQQRFQEGIAEQERQIAELSHAAQLAKEAHHAAETRLRAAEGGLGAGRAVETVLSSGLPGVDGTLAQLGEVEDTYARALEIAGGGRLKNIVVRDEDVAQEAIFLLKDRKAGRATFLPLNRLAPPRRLSPIGNPGFIGYAVNLVKFDPKFAAAFHLALGDTVVVRDYASAKPCQGQYRMVTLDGELFEKSGAITGGEGGRGEGMRFTASLAKEVECAASKLEAALIRLSRRQEDLSRFRQDLERSREEARASQAAVDKLVLELADRARRAGQAEAELARLEGAMAALLAEEAPNAERVAQLAEQLLSLDAETNELEYALSELEDQLQSERLGELQEVVNTHDGKVQALQQSVRTCSYDLKDLELEAERTLEARMALQTDLAVRETSLAELAEKVIASERSSASQQEVLAELESQRQALRERLGELQKEREHLAEAVRRSQSQVNDRQLEHSRLLEGLAATREALQDQLPKLRDLEDALWMQGIEPPTAPPGESTEALQRQMNHLEGRMRALEPVNMLAIETYDRESARQQELSEKVEKLGEEREALLRRIDEISLRKKACFMDTFMAVDANFREIFASLSEGTGQLVLEDPADPFSGGLIIKAQPRDKKMQRLEAMSGGEKSLTALAFVFAFQRHQPAPFYAFDEVDAALDGANAERLAVMIRKQTENAQFLVVSHRKPMLERAHHTIGVSTRKDGVTRVMGITWGGARSPLGEHAPPGSGAPPGRLEESSHAGDSQHGRDRIGAAHSPAEEIAG